MFEDDYYTAACEMYARWESGDKSVLDLHNLHQFVLSELRHGRDVPSEILIELLSRTRFAKKKQLEDATIISELDLLGLFDEGNSERRRIFAWHKGLQNRPVEDLRKIERHCRLLDANDAYIYIKKRKLQLTRGKLLPK